jgi:hypothetical protein
MNAHTFFTRIALVALFTLPLFTSGCATQTMANNRVTAATGRVMSRAEVTTVVPRAYLGDQTYAEVNSEWLKEFYPQFRAELFRLGISKWENRYDCNRFAELYTAVAQATFYRQAFHSPIRAQSLALGTYWYIRRDGRGGHALVQVLTERGVIFIEPQTGELVNLTPAESASAYLQVI